MVGSTTVVLSTSPNRARFKNKIPQYDPKRLGLRYQVSNSSHGQTEYQTAFIKWPFQLPRTCIRPEINHIPTTANMDMKTTYRNDYVTHTIAKRSKAKKEMHHVRQSGTMNQDTTYRIDYAPKTTVRMEPFKTDQEYKKPIAKFQGNSMYQVSYKSFDPQIAAQCRPSQTKPTECIVRGKDKFTGSSTFRNDYQKHENIEKRKPIIPEENTKTSKEPMETKTMYNEIYTEKELPKQYKVMLQATHLTPTPNPPLQLLQQNSNAENVADSLSMKLPEENQMITTFTSDFKPHYNVSRRTCCKPPESNNQFYDTPFDGQTTQGIAYKVWPVSPPEKPLWAIKPEYKRPHTGMLLKSTYMADFKDPGVCSPPQPVKIKERGDIIKHEASGDGDSSTTYQADFQKWEVSTPANSFLVKQVYEVPKETMIFQSTQRTHYKGVQTERAALCRQVSEHRNLYKDKTMVFNTTYKDTYKDNRPKSCPAGTSSKQSITDQYLPLKKHSERSSSRDSGIVIIDLETQAGDSKSDK